MSTQKEIEMQILAQWCQFCQNNSCQTSMQSKFHPHPSENSNWLHTFFLPLEFAIFYYYPWNGNKTQRRGKVRLAWRQKLRQKRGFNKKTNKVFKWQLQNDHDVSRSIDIILSVSVIVRGRHFVSCQNHLPKTAET